MTDRAEPDWERIVVEHGPAVWATVCRILRHHADAEDCYQQTFLDALQCSRNRAIANWAPFLATIATRRAIDRLRQLIATRKKGVETGASDSFLVEGGSPGARTSEQELMDTLRKGLAILPEKQAAAFWLRSVEELSYVEIAAELAIDANEVGVLLHRARTSLQRHFAADRAAGRELR